MATFIPPPKAPPVLESAAPEYGAKPATVESHGYRYVVTGNTLLSPGVIERVLAAAATPKEALADLLKAYHREGYTLIAITGQVTGKEVHVSVFQGMVTDLKTADGLGPYFSGLYERDDVTQPQIVRRQILAGTYAARSGKKVEVNLGPAENPGGSAVTVSEAPIPDYFPISGAITFGNYGSRYSSGYVVGANAAANLTHGIQLTGNYTQGLPGLRESSYGSVYYQGGLGASIVTPYGIYGFSVNGTHFRLGQETAPLNPTGDILTYRLDGSQLVYADASTRVSLTEALTRVSYVETVFQGYFTLLNQKYNYVSLGANVDRSLTLGGLPGSINAGVVFNMGISPSSGTLYDGYPGVPTSHFRYTNFSLRYQQTLPRGFQADLTGQAQWAVNTLPSQQQWTLGGFGNLTAWEPGVVVGDSGYVARLEVDAPAFERFNSSARLGAFLEAGGSAFTTPPSGTSPWQILTDAGVSLRLRLPYGFSATAMAATPIREVGFNAIGRRNLDFNRLDAFFVVQKGF